MNFIESIKSSKALNRDHMTLRVILTVFGVLLCGVAVGFSRYAAFGVDPFTVLMSGLDALIPIRYGTLYVIVNAVLLLFSLIFDRHYIGLGTIINLFFLGYVTEFTHKVLSDLFPTPYLGIRIVVLILGILLICIALALYMTADLGVSTYDAVALIIVNTWHIGKFGYMRIITDITVIVLGIICYAFTGNSLAGLTAFIGIGTIITAFFMGPFVEFISNRFIKKLFK